MLKTEYSQQMFLTQKMNLNLSVLQMNRVKLNLFIENTIARNPLIASKNNFIPWNSKTSTPVIEDILTQEKTLFEQLREELILDIDENDYPILYLIIGNLTRAGFLHQDLSKICQHTNINLDRAEHIRFLVKNSSYLGLASYNSKEYLLFMVIHNYGDQSIEYLIAPLLTKHKHLNLKKIEKLLPSCDKIQLENGLVNIKKIPTSPFNMGYARTIYPDFTISVEDNDKLSIKMSAYSSPTIEIKDYTEKSYSTKELRKFLKEAENLQKALELRQDTLQKHAEALILLRSDFFLDTKQTSQVQLKDIANITNRHVSTVSRTLKNRYFLFNNIIYPFSVLWNHRIGNSDQYTIKKMIQELINNETETLSDTIITEILNKKGIKIARRTVNKYRQELQINSLYHRQ